jgi:hypothetical protein
LLKHQINKYYHTTRTELHTNENSSINALRYDDIFSCRLLDNFLFNTIPCSSVLLIRINAHLGDLFF